MIASSLVYAGLLAAFLGAVSVLKPLRILRIPNRGVGAGLIAFGLAAIATGMALPSPLERSPRPPTRIDDWVPAFQFAEFHETHVQATPAQVWSALKLVTAQEIRFFQLLTWIRSPRLPGSKVKEAMLAPPPSKPILDVATSGGFVLLAEEPQRELVVGMFPCRAPAPKTPEQFKASQRPGECKGAMNFLLEDQGAKGTRLVTETRVFATDEESLKRFSRYWRVIYPGSAIIRRSWLGAVKRRAEAGATP